MWLSSCCAINRGRNASTPWMGPHRSTSITKRQSSWLVSRDRARIGDARVVEHHVHVAEHSKRLIGQVDDVVELADVADDAVRVDPVGAQCRNRVLQGGLVDVASMRRAPRRANSCAVAKPMPLAPPVMTAARPWKLSTARTLCAQRRSVRRIPRRIAQIGADRAPRIGVLAGCLPVGRLGASSPHGRSARPGAPDSASTRTSRITRPSCRTTSSAGTSTLPAPGWCPSSRSRTSRCRCRGSPGRPGGIAPGMPSAATRAGARSP